MNYVDGFVIAVQTARKDTYLHHATVVAQVFKELGAWPSKALRGGFQVVLEQK